MKYIISIFTILFTCLNINAEVRIQMEKEAGVYKVPCSVNGLKLKFIFDTGASNVSISQVYAEMMFDNGYLTESDILGVSQSTIADGSNIDNIVINLKSVEIGGLTLENVSAVVVPTQNAPLLLGQSAIQRLGVVSIDGNYLVIHNAVPQYTEEELDKIFKKAEEMFDNDITSEALKYYKIIYESYGNDTNPFILFKMGICYSRLKDYESSKQCHLKAIELDGGNNYDGILFEVYPVLSAIYFGNNEDEKGLDYLKLALKYAPNEREKAKLCKEIGSQYSSTFYSHQDYFKSIEYYNEAIKIYEQMQKKNDLNSDDEFLFVMTLCYKAYALEHLSLYEEAIESLNKAQKINEINHKEAYEIMINKGLSDCYKGLSKSR